MSAKDDFFSKIIGLSDDPELFIKQKLQKIKDRLLPEACTPEDRDRFLIAQETIQGCEKKIRFSLNLRLTAEALVYKESGWFSFIFEKGCFKETVTLSRNSIETYSWTFIPCLLVNQTDSLIRYFLIGLTQNGKADLAVPDWARETMDEDFYKSIENAHKQMCQWYKKKNPACDSNRRGFSLFCAPLTPSTGNRRIFNGASGGVSFCLGIKSLLENSVYPMTTVVTGKLCEKDIGDVDFVVKKREAAKREGFECFIYPSKSKRIACDDVYPMTCLPAENLGDVFLIAALLKDHNNETINQIYDCISTAEKFANQCNTISDKILIPTEAKNRLDIFARVIPSENSLFKKFIGSYSEIVKSKKFCLALFLSNLFNNNIEESPVIDESLKVEWYCINLEMANHSGNVEDAKKWTEKSNKLMPQAVKTPKGRILLKWLSNHEFVNNRHNHFVFRPEIPAELAELIKRAEEVFLIETNGHKGAAEPSIAAIYGTIAQNYGFCGPLFLDKTLEYSKKAIKRFGGIYNADMPEKYREDCLRQYNYITYACLDAGDFKNAEKHLLLYLERDSIEQVSQMVSSFSEWHHSLLARFIADTKRSFRSYINFCTDKESSITSEKHPWQLWYFNMAKCAWCEKNWDQAKTFAIKSLAHCETMGPGNVISVMGLLPLSFLYENRMINEPVKKKFNLFFETALAINPNFFKSFTNESMETILHAIHTTPEFFFPFSYR